MDLFDKIEEEQTTRDAPLADFMRPTGLETFAGQEHLLGEDGPLHRLMQSRQAVSMLLWGPPGVGKTTLARIFAQACEAEIIELNAVTSGVADVRKAADRGRANRKLGRRTILFIDEIHRFNKAQQDGLLQSVETGTLFLIGATTENPSFEVIAPLLSRCRVFTLKPLDDDAIMSLIDRAVPVLERKAELKLDLDDAARTALVFHAAGDARELLNGIEMAAFLARPRKDGTRHIDEHTVSMAFQRKTLRYDKSGDNHYDTISAFIKSVRGSDPNAALHYLARMLEAGEDPMFIARRLIILAAEDIGNADPQALVLATSACHAVHFIGLPEAQLVLSQVTTYLAATEKSNAAYAAIRTATKDIRETAVAPIPLHLRNAPTDFSAKQGHGAGYMYPHDHPDAFVPADYMPENLKGSVYYLPNERGDEGRLAERLRRLWPVYRQPEEKDPES